MIKSVTMFIVLLCIKSSMAQFENTDTGARAIGLNGAYTSISNNSIAVFYNPSGLGQIRFREISAFYTPSVFGISGLTQTSVSYAEPLSFGTVGSGIKTFGFDLYREFNLLLSYGNVIREKVFLGFSINYYDLSIQNYGSASSFGLDIGALAYITDFMRWGFAAKNMTGSTIGISKEKIPQVYNTGLTFQPKDDLLFVIEAEKDVRYPVSFRSGFEYVVFDQAEIRSGISTEPVSFTAGLGLVYGLFQLDYAINNHQDLGISHQGSITVNFGGSEAKKFYRKQLVNAFK